MKISVKTLIQLTGISDYYADLFARLLSHFSGRPRSINRVINALEWAVFEKHGKDGDYLFEVIKRKILEV